MEPRVLDFIPLSGAEHLSHALVHRGAIGFIHATIPMPETVLRRRVRLQTEQQHGLVGRHPVLSVFLVDLNGPKARIADPKSLAHPFGTVEHVRVDPHSPPSSAAIPQTGTLGAYPTFHLSVSLCGSGLQSGNVKNNDVFSPQLDQTRLGEPG